MVVCPVPLGYTSFPSSVYHVAECLCHLGLAASVFLTISITMERYQVRPVVVRLPPGQVSGTCILNVTWLVIHDVKEDQHTRHIIPFPTMIYSAIIPSKSPKESGLFSSIGVVAQSEQGNIWHRMFPREHTAPYASLFSTLVRQWKRWSPIQVLTQLNLA